MSLVPHKELSAYGERNTKLGEGAYARVYGTRDGYAIKDVPNEEAFTPDSSALGEIVSLLKIRSPYVIRLNDVIIKEDSTYLVLPRAKGRLYPYEVKDIKKTIKEMLYGIVAIHNANLLHLDIKPQNTLINKEGGIWLADLGLSLIHTCAFPPLRGEFYTLPYRPPESILRGPMTEKSDIWALGVLFAEIFLSRGMDEDFLLFDVRNEEELLREIVALIGPIPKGLGWPGIVKDSDEEGEGNIQTYLRASGLSQDEIDFISYILRFDPKKRPTADEILTHPYLEDKPVDINTCYEKLLVFSHYPKNGWGKLKRKRRRYIKALITIAFDFSVSDKSLSLAVYLLDKMFTLKDILEEDILLYGVAALRIATYFYENSVLGLEDAIDILERDMVDITSATTEILRVTNYDLSPATSYIFLSYAIERDSFYAERKKKILTYWKRSLYTNYHFNRPEEVANIILSLSDERLERGKEELELLKQMKG